MHKSYWKISKITWLVDENEQEWPDVGLEPNSPVANELNRIRPTVDDEPVSGIAAPWSATYLHVNFVAPYDANVFVECWIRAEIKKKKLIRNSKLGKIIT